MQDLLDEKPMTTQKVIQFRIWVILIWIAVFVIGYLFRIMHWPGNSLLRVIGAGGFMAYSLSFLILVSQRSSLIIVLNCLSLLWIIVLLWGMFFNDGYPFNEQGLIAQGIAFTFLFLVHFVILYFMKKNREAKKTIEK